MKILVILISFSLPALAQIKDCGTDYACFYNQKARLIEQDRKKQREALEEYRNQQLQLQRLQLEEIQEQNSMLEEQLQELNARQEKFEEQQKELLNELKENTQVKRPKVKEGNERKE